MTSIEGGLEMLSVTAAIIHYGTALALLWCLIAGVGR